MLKTHQILGYFTLGAMVAQGFIGGELYNATGERYNSLYKTHKNMSKVVNAGYFTGAALSLFSPPPLVNKKTKGFSSIKVHRFLSNIHFLRGLSSIEEALKSWPLMRAPPQLNVMTELCIKTTVLRL